MDRLDQEDRRWMAAAVELARRAVGDTAENPPVGCLLVRDGAVVGRGRTQTGGRPHAEAVALARAGGAARGATAYVTLEPCAHHGRTPPCAEALVAAGVTRVVAAVADPDPRVDGAGFRTLEQAGVTVRSGVLAEPAREILAGFLSRVGRGRPYVSLKLATSLDGRIAAAGGHSRWITGAAARRRGHLMRAQADAILIGIGTGLADDPDLTCRIPGLADRSPPRIVLDSRLRTPPEARLVRTAGETPTVIVTGPSADPASRVAVERHGVEVVEVPVDPAGRCDLLATLNMLGGRGVNRLLVEGGAGVTGSLIRAGLVDEIHWFRAGLVLGADGVPAVGPQRLATVDRGPRWRRIDREDLGPDTLERFRLETAGSSA